MSDEGPTTARQGKRYGEKTEARWLEAQGAIIRPAEIMTELTLTAVYEEAEEGGFIG